MSSPPEFPFSVTTTVVWGQLNARLPETTTPFQSVVSPVVRSAGPVAHLRAWCCSRLEDIAFSNLPLPPPSPKRQNSKPHQFGYFIDLIVPGSEDGGPRSRARRCQLFDGDGEKQVYTSGPGEQENHPARAQVSAFASSFHVALQPPPACVCLSSRWIFCACSAAM